jgi:hypothetical protein
MVVAQVQILWAAAVAAALLKLAQVLPLITPQEKAVTVQRLLFLVLL